LFLYRAYEGEESVVADTRLGHYSFASLPENAQRTLDAIEPDVTFTPQYLKNKEDFYAFTSINPDEYSGEQLANLTTLYQYLPDTSAKKQALIQQLKLALYHARARDELDFMEGRKRVGESETAVQYRTLLSQLGTRWTTTASVSKTRPLQTILLNGNKDLGIEGWGLNGLNGWRFYWVWISCFVPAILQLMQALQAINTSQIQAPLNTLSPGFGWLSVVIYPLRQLLVLSIILERTFLPSKKEEGVGLSRWERFKHHAEKELFIILNDILWGTVNILCFAIYYGQGLLGFIGNAMTVGLLLADLTLTILRVRKTLAAQDKKLKIFQDELDGLTQKIAVTTDLTQRAVLWEHFQQLQQMKAQCELEYKYERRALYSQLTVAIVLPVAYFIFVASLQTMTLSAFPLHAVVGASLLFVSGLISASFNAYLSVQKHGEMALVQFNRARQLLAARSPTEYITRFEELQIKQYLHEAASFKDLEQHSQYQFIRTTLLYALIPVVLFVSFGFLPLIPAVVTFSAGFILAVASDFYLQRHAPQKATWDPPSQVDGEAKTHITVKNALDTINEACNKPAQHSLFFKAKLEDNGWNNLSPSMA